MEHGWILGMHISWWVFLILLGIVFIAFLEIEPKHKARKRREDPLEILKRRYASGEIDTEEYEQRKAHLSSDEKKGESEDHSG
ncbi:MAG: SHOCT domain-containing protein [Acidobacteria bacterium]|nr:MAG: SHOCT domain-containing protein [Acidobacteriota bacterium]REJ98264.1 MAG: SHOCT domain-containing protein [Acidobacteriota bacterium]REK17008.1 MAG: SHOCT domain-containing protein [Acidobacteriota bacterium]REK42918.1 MAG: SHOCT domain-containing protein [Acidobacteriota bacterium]